MDTTCIVGTDVASFYLYDPEALHHRVLAPWDWFSDESPTAGDLGELTVPERSDGCLVVVQTAIPVYVEGRDTPVWVGSDGHYHFRCTTTGLTTDEALREYPETRAADQPQLIHVTHGRLLLDGGYVIPCNDPERVRSIDEAVARDLAAWLSLPNGTYQVAVHHLKDPNEENTDEWDDAEGGEGEGDDAPNIVLTFTRVSP